MNRVILMGRLTRDPEVRYSQNDQSMAVARYTLAVDRRGRKDGNDGQQSADFINCTAFRQQAEFVEKYLRKGMKIAVTGRIQSGSYTNRERQRVYTTDVIVDEHEFCESRNTADSNSGDGYQQNSGNSNGGNRSNTGYQNNGRQNSGQANGNRQSGNYQNNGYQNGGNSFMNIPDGLDEELPFH